jgi:selenocysteine lyase/cysteine desulfurase
VLEKSVPEIRRHEEELTARLIEGLLLLPGVTIYGTRDWERRIGIVSFNLDGFDSSEVASRLDVAYGVCVRSGLHCSPLAHRTAGTLEKGTVRVGFSYMNTVEDVDYLLGALGEIAKTK